MVLMTFIHVRINESTKDAGFVVELKETQALTLCVRQFDYNGLALPLIRIRLERIRGDVKRSLRMVGEKTKHERDTGGIL